MPYWRLYYHFVWSTINREPLINNDMQPTLFKYIQNKTNNLECIFHAIGGVDDHVHLVVSIPPKIAVAEFIQKIKGGSSHYVNHVYKSTTQFAWQDEYGVLSFGEKHLDTIVQYVLNQKQHHENQQIYPVLEMMIG